MTRKRFIKLMMSYGVSRNESTEFAAFVRETYGTYKEAYTENKRRLEDFRIEKNIDRIIEAMAKAGVTFSEAAEAMMRLAASVGRYSREVRPGIYVGELRPNGEFHSYV